MKKWLIALMLALPLAADELDTGDTAWMMMSTAMVLLSKTYGSLP